MPGCEQVLRVLREARAGTVPSARFAGQRESRGTKNRAGGPQFTRLGDSMAPVGSGPAWRPAGWGWGVREPVIGPHLAMARVPGVSTGPGCGEAARSSLLGWTCLGHERPGHTPQGPAAPASPHRVGTLLRKCGRKLRQSPHPALHEETSKCSCTWLRAPTETNVKTLYLTTEPSSPGPPPPTPSRSRGLGRMM